MECPATLVLTSLLDPALGRLLVGTLYNTLLYKQASDGIPGNSNKELGGQRARWENISGNGLYFVLDSCELWKQTL